MTATLTQPYRRTAQDARRIAEAFRASTKGIDGKLFRERLAALAAGELPEGPEGRHSGAYLAVITEVAADSEQADRDDARKFATAFVNRPSAYSRTKAGLAAVQLEAWLIEDGGALYAKFVETVLDSGDTKFLAIFEGQLSDQDKDKLREGVGGFVKIVPIAEAGAVNYDSGEILEFSMFDCTAVGKLDKDALPKTVTPSDAPQPEQKPQFESLLPREREDYDRVFEQDGVSRSVAMYLFGADTVRRAVVTDGQLAFKDRNGVPWLSEDGDRWLPDVDAIDAHPEAADESDVAPAPKSAPIYESSARTGALRSYCNTWAVFENPVLMEGEARHLTIISAHDKVRACERPIEEARRIVEEASALYADSPVEGDLYIEAALAEYAEEHGTDCVNEAEVLQLVADVPNRPTREDRDYDVRVLSTRRLAEATLGHGGYDAQALCKIAEDALRKKAPGMFSRAYFDNRFGQGGQVFIKFYNAPENAGDVAKLNSKPNFTISIDPFDNEGRALSTKVKAVMLIAYPRDIGWRGKTATPDAMARYLEAFIEKLDLTIGVVEADDEEDNEKPEKKPKEGKPANPR